MRLTDCTIFVAAVLTSLAAAGTSPIQIENGQWDVRAIDRVQRDLEDFVNKHPDSAAGHYQLAVAHMAAYALGRDALEVILAKVETAPLTIVGCGIPPYARADRLATVPKARALHLAHAVHALKRATALDGADINHWLALGYALYECRGRFVKLEWPYAADDFDKQAQEHRGNGTFWQDQALEALRKTGVSVPKGARDDEPYNACQDEQGNSPMDEASLHIVAILKSRAKNTEAEKKEIAVREPGVARAAKTHALRSGRGPWFKSNTLPPQPPEYEQLYPVSKAGLEAAQVYARALDAMISTSSKYEKLPLLGFTSPRPPSDRILEERFPLVKEYLAFNAETLRLLHEAAAHTACRFPVDFTQGAAMGLPHCAQMRDLACVLALKALYAAQTGDAAGAVTALEDGIALGESLRNEPVTVSQLVRIGVIGIIVEMTESVVNRVSLDATQLTSLQENLAAVEDKSCMVKAYRGEMFSQLDSLKKAIAAKPEENEEVPAPYGGGKRLMPEDLPRQRAVMEKIIEAAAKPVSEAKALIESVAMSGPILVPALSRPIVAAARMDSSLRRAQVALAVERYWLAHGNPPEKIEALVPAFLHAIPTDPFDMQPLAYKRVGNGFMVESFKTGAEGTQAEERTRQSVGLAFAVGDAKKDEPDQSAEQPN